MYKEVCCLILQSPVVNHEGEMAVEFKALGDLSQFLARPVSSVGKVSIWVNGWINGQDLWSSMPALENDIKLKFEGIGAEVSELHLLLLDTDSGDIYKTNTQKVWNRAPLASYIEKLNSKVLAQTTIETTPSLVYDPLPPQQKQDLTWGIAVLLFAGALIVGLMLKSKNARSK